MYAWISPFTQRRWVRRSEIRATGWRAISANQRGALREEGAGWCRAGRGMARGREGERLLPRHRRADRRRRGPPGAYATGGARRPRPGEDDDIALTARRFGVVRLGTERAAARRAARRGDEREHERADESDDP